MTSAPISTRRFGQPRQLYLLFFTEMWERFSFYGMKALLIAYMVGYLKIPESDSYGMLAAYSGLVYTLPLAGGWLADRYLGYKSSVMCGGLLMISGHLVLALPYEMSLFYGMALVIMGNGFFKPNISSLVGALYKEGDARRDRGFSLFYMGINIGAALGGLLCGYVGERISWHSGFGLAAAFMLMGQTAFVIGRKHLPDVKPLLRVASIVKLLIIAGYILLMLAVVFLLQHHVVTGWFMAGLGLAALAYVLLAARRLSRDVQLKLYAALILIFLSVIFWSFYGQTYGSLNLFATRNVNMRVGNITLAPLAVNNFVGPAWVVILSIVFVKAWAWLGRKNTEPGTAVKFLLSFVFLGGGFLILYLFCSAARDGLIALPGLIACYFFIVCGELCLSPIGLSMITSLSPKHMVAMMMGIWFFATAIGEMLAAKLGSLMVVPAGVSGDPVLSLPYYSSMFFKIAIGCFAASLIVLLLVKPLKRMVAAHALIKQEGN